MATASANIEQERRDKENRPQAANDSAKNNYKTAKAQREYEAASEMSQASAHKLRLQANAVNAENNHAKNHSLLSSRQSKSKTSTINKTAGGISPHKPPPSQFH